MNAETKSRIQPSRIFFSAVLVVLSVVGLNALLIFHVPLVAETFESRDQGLPWPTAFFVDLINFLKNIDSLAILFILPMALACIPNLSRKHYYPIAIGLSAIPLAALTLPALLGWPGTSLEPPNRHTAEELAAVPLGMPLPDGEPRDYLYENVGVVDLLRDVAAQNDLRLVFTDRPPNQPTTIHLRNATWRNLFEVALEPLGYAYYDWTQDVEVITLKRLIDDETINAIAIPIRGDIEAIRDSLAPLIDSAAGGAVYIDSSRHALVVYEHPASFNDILAVVERLDAVPEPSQTSSEAPEQ